MKPFILIAVSAAFLFSCEQNINHAKQPPKTPEQEQQEQNLKTTQPASTTSRTPTTSPEQQ